MVRPDGQDCRREIESRYFLIWDKRREIHRRGRLSGSFRQTGVPSERGQSAQWLESLYARFRRSVAACSSECDGPISGLQYALNQIVYAGLQYCVATRGLVLLPKTRIRNGATALLSFGIIA